MFRRALARLDSEAKIASFHGLHGLRHHSILRRHGRLVNVTNVPFPRATRPYLPSRKLVQAFTALSFGTLPSASLIAS